MTSMMILLEIQTDMCINVEYVMRNISRELIMNKVAIIDIF